MGCAQSKTATARRGDVRLVDDDDATTTTTEVRVKLVLLGASGAGKTALSTRFVRGTFDGENASATVGAAFASTTRALDDARARIKFEIWDTAGQERYASLAPLYYRGATAAMIAPDPRDPTHVPLPWDGPALDGPVTVAVTTESGLYDIHPGIVELVERTADLLADAGYRVVRVDPPPVHDGAREWFRAGITELATTLGPVMAQMGSPTINRIFEWYYELGELLDRDGYLQALADRTRYLREWSLFLDEHPLLVTPFLMRPLYDWNVDAESFEGLKDVFDSAAYSLGINYLGLPAGVLGLDLVDERPAAVQIVGRRWREDLICDAMEAVQVRNGVLTDRLWARDDA